MNPIRSLPVVAALLLLPATARPADAAPQAAAAAPASSPADAIVGRWKPSDQDAVVAISRGPEGLGGVMVESKAKPALVGQPMFRSLVYDAARGEWTGEVFAVKKGEFVPAVIRLTRDGFMLTAGKGMFSKKIAWTRA